MRYIDLGPALFKSCYELEYHLDVLRSAADPNHPVTRRTVEEINSLLKDLSTVRDGIMRGEFKEPEIISMMTWLPTEEKTALHGAESDAEDSSGNAQGECMTPASEIGDFSFSTSVSFSEPQEQTAYAPLPSERIKSWHCMDCGKALPDGSMFCGWCGKSNLD